MMTDIRTRQGEPSMRGSLLALNANNIKALRENCPWMAREYNCDQRNRPLYRPLDGTCNLLSLPWLGSAMTPYRRLEDPDYGPNGGLRQKRRNGSHSGPLPNPRLLSNMLTIKKDREDTQGEIKHSKKTQLPFDMDIIENIEITSMLMK